MRVVLDTNIIHGDWHLGGANFRYLCHYLNNEQTQLLLPQVVLQEVNNIQARELAALATSIQSQVKRASQFNGRPIAPEPLPLSIAEYDILLLLKRRIDNVVIVGYDDVPHSAVVERALKAARPFQKSGDGYRDTLIWLSLLTYLAGDKSTEPVAFITNNRSDFFDPKAKDDAQFHPDLAADVAAASLNARIVPFDSLDAFVKSTIDRDAHALDYNQVEGMVSWELETGAVRLLESRESGILAVLNDWLTPDSNLVLGAESIGADIREGIEDFTVMSTKDLGDGNIYVRVDFDLRIVDLSVAVPRAEYDRATLTGNRLAPFYDISLDDQSAILQTTIRPRFDASVIVNRATEDASGFEVARIRVKY